jgi:hypothetical protein
MKKLIYSLILLFLLVSLKEVYAIDPPTLIYPPNGGTNIPTPVNFDWSDVNGAAYYHLYVYIGFTLEYEKDSILTSGYTVDLGGNTQYFWKVRAYDATGNWAESATWSFTTGSSLPSAPVLQYPPDDTTNMPTNITFNWADNPGTIQYYTLQYTTDPNFINGITTVNSSASQQYVTGLSTNTVYFWRVSATNSTGTGPYSPIWNFETLPAIPPAPTLISPPNNSGNITLTPLLDWTDVPVGTVVYDVEVHANSGFNNLIYEAHDLTVSQQLVPPNVLSGGQQYWWHARARNIAGPGPWSSTFTFSTQNAPPAPPVLVYPPDSSENIPRNNFQYTWNVSYGANSYNIQVSTNSGFTSFIYNSTTTGTNWTQSTLLGFDTRYYWRVRATSISGGTGVFSSTNTFKTIPGLLPPPILNYPGCGTQNISLTPLMHWSAISGAVAYRLQIAVNSTYGTLIFNQIIYDTAYQVTPGLLTGGATYYWRVNSINAAMNEGSYQSGSCSFITKQTLNTNLKVFLEGFYNGTTQVRDTIRVYLAQTTSPYTLKDSSLAYLNTNGTDTVSFENSVAGNYYIIIKHRNHLESWSALPVTLTLGSYVAYDFTTGANKTYGNNAKLVGTSWVLIGGDANQDGLVFVNDYNLLITQFGWDGYISCDMNGDTFVDGYDLLILYSNINANKKRPQ